jgi:frataxin-like iron-binding protein CyaY
MSLTLRTTLGCTEAVISDDGGLKRFYQVADVLSEELKIKFNNKEDDFDTIDWEFRFKGHNLTLHYNIYNGISIFPTKTRDALNKDNKAVVELAGMLEGKLFAEGQRNIA